MHGRDWGGHTRIHLVCPPTEHSLRSTLHAITQNRYPPTPYVSHVYVAAAIPLPTRACSHASYATGVWARDRSDDGEQGALRPVHPIDERECVVLSARCSMIHNDVGSSCPVTLRCPVTWAAAPPPPRCRQEGSVPGGGRQPLGVPVGSGVAAPAQGHLPEAAGDRRPPRCCSPGGERERDHSIALCGSCK